MKIKKNGKVNASESICIAELATDATTCCPNERACNFIRAAIEVLAESASTDEIARDSIANLSVVLLDLKGSC